MWFVYDGYYEIRNQKVMMEFHGDYWNRNPNCSSAKTLYNVVGMTSIRTLEKLGIFGIYLPADVTVCSKRVLVGQNGLKPKNIEINT